MLVCGCDNDPQKQLEQVEKRVVSWSATLELTSHHFDDAAVTRKYVRQIVKAARQDLDEQQETLAQTPAEDPKHRELDERLRQVRAQADALARRSERGERAS